MVLKALHALPKGGLTKTLRIMKITAIILLSACLTASANGHSQKVTLSEKNALLEKVFTSIKQQTGYEFLYTDEMLQKAERITIDLKSVELQEALNLVFKNQPLTFSIIERTVVIKPKAPEVIKEKLPPPPISVKGRVVNEQGEGVVATVMVKGANNGVTTNADGTFELKNVDENATLVISGVGIEETVVIKVNGKIDLGNISTETKIISGQDVTLNTGYMSSTKKKSTMNIYRVEGKELENQPVSSLINALAGRVPGLDITPKANQPGRAPTIEIRGNNSLTTGGSSPLYVIDGVQIPSRPLNDASGLATFDPIAGLSTQNIESIEILKDAAATAIYGSKGANGVIRITTKKASLGKSGTSFNLNLYQGFGKMARKVKLLNKDQYLEMRKEAFKNTGAVPSIFDHDLNGNWDTNRETDWQDVLLGGTSSIKDAQATFSGGNENSSFRIGAGYHKETTIYPGDGFGFYKVNADMSFTHRSINKKFQVSGAINFGYLNDKNFNYNTFPTMAWSLSPVAPKLFNDDGTLNWQFYGGGNQNSWDNPFAELLKTFDVSTRNIIANSTLGYNITQELQLKVITSFSTTGNNDTRKAPNIALAPSFRDIYPSTASFANSERNSFMVEPQLSFNKVIKNHSFRTMIGSTYQQSRTIYRLIQGSGYPSVALMGSVRGATTITSQADENTHYKYASVYLHVGYDYASKYLIDLTVRRDGSSKFGPNNRYGNFGALGAGHLSWDCGEDYSVYYEKRNYGRVN